MKKSHIVLGGSLFFACLLIINWITKISPDNNITLIVFSVLFFIMFLVQMLKEKRT